MNKVKSLTLVRQVVGFGIAGVVGFAVEFVIITVAMELGMGPIMPRVVSLPLAILCSFFINRYFSFQKFSALAAKEIGAYYLGMLGGAVASFMIYTLCIFSQISPAVSLIIATCCAACLNFLFSRHLFVKMP